MYNLTKPQKLIYDMEKFAGGSIATICGSIIINGEKDTDTLAIAVNEIYRINDALRIKITEKDGVPYQTVTEYKEKNINILRFKDKSELNTYAQNYAKEPMDFYGELCNIQIVVLNNEYGILVKMHHIISDAQTLALIGSQFSKLLNGEMPESYSYLDYIATEQKYTQSKRYQKDKEYYIEQFKKCDEVTYISDKQVKSYSANRKTFVIDKEQTAKIAEYAKENNTSLFALFMTVLGVYVSRIKMNTEKFYIGTAVLNRNGIAEQNTAGMFINTVPVLSELENNATFKENLEKTSENLMTMFRHQKFNYGDVLKTLRSEFDFSGNLYDVMLSYQNSQTNVENSHTEWYACGMQTESLAMHIDDRDSEGILKIHYDYQTEKFTEKEIERMHTHLLNLLFDAMSEDKKIISLDMLSAGEKHTLLYDFNDTKADYPKDKCIHQLFEEQVAKNPDKTAVIACDKTLTYDELNRLSNRIAHGLIEKGVKTGDIVAFALPRRSYLIATMFGILKAGSAYMPIDPDYPQDRIDYMLEDSKSKFFITDNNFNEFVSDNEENPNIEITSNSLCYCIYTSGTTGKPKGVLIRHNNLVNFCDNNNNNYQHCMIKDGTRLISTFKCCFDAFGVDYALFLLNGLSLVLANDYEIMQAENLAKLIEKYNVDVIHSTPSTIKALLTNASYVNAIGKTNIIMVAAENFTSGLYDFLRSHTSANLFNGYGPSETTIGVSFGEIVSTDITIGKPIANTQIHIVDKFNNPMPIGIVGELCISGDCVGAGYLNRPELTAEKFIDNPFGEGKLYKTGDLAYWREDGNIAYVGRNDFQVKIRGLRIELGEIENAICSVDGISQAVVVVRKDKNDRQLICAFYTESTAVDAAEIKSAILSKLPKYMLPHIFMVLDKMPLTPSGKINRKALPEVDLNNISNDTEYVAPVTEKETILCQTVESVLNTEKVGTSDNFFDLGGDSLKAIELIAKLESKGYKTTVKTVFDCETIKELAEKSENTEAKTANFDWTGDIPATDAQMRVYTAQSMQETSTLYNVPYCFKVENLDVGKLQSALNKLIARHEILRTHFENKNGQIIQVINNKAKCSVEKLNSDNMLDFMRPFDLSKAPLLRVGYCENTVMIDMHHIITDGSSMPVFFNELNELYMGRELENAPVQYKECAVCKQYHTESEKYWLSVFDDELPTLEINTDFPRGTRQSYNGTALYDTVDIALHNKIKEKCKCINITPYVFYMGAFNVLLSKFSGNEDVVVGMPVSGRDGKFIDTIGMFVNTVALRNKSVGTKTVSEFLSEVKESSINAIANQDYPFGELIKKLHIDTQNRNPLFDVMFAYQSEEMTDVVFGDKTAELLTVPITTSKYDLTLNVMPRENDVVLMAEYCTDLYRESTVKRFIAGFKLILEAMLGEKEPIYNISAISKEEVNKILYQFNDTKADYPKDKCIHQIFEEQVVKTPDKEAVIACDKTLTYDELNRLSNRIAHGLIENGVKKGDIVAFALPRKSYLIATMFGILKAGSAYMPIDPDYPQDRIDYMLEDSKAKFFITENNLNDFISDNEENPNVEVLQKDVYCALHTSGSTGKPKMLLLKQRGIMNFMSFYKNALLYERIDSVISVTITTFDAFIQDTIIPISMGVKSVLGNEEAIFNQAEFEKIFQYTNAAAIFSTPTKFKTYINNSKTKDFLKHIRVFFIGGEVFPADLYDLIIENSVTPHGFLTDMVPAKQPYMQPFKNCCDIELYNMYGPTETTLWCTTSENMIKRRI